MEPEMNSTNWTTSYTEYLTRSAALSARTLNLYQLALDHMSQGKLPPTIFQDHFPAFAVAHAAEFMNRYAEIGSRFLSGVMQLGTQSWQQQSSNGSGADIQPPHFDSSNPSRWYEQVAEYAGQLNARAVKAYRTQLDKVAAGETTPSEVQQQTAEQMAHDLPAYLERVTGLYFDLLNGLNDVRADYEETYFHGLLAAVRPEPGEPRVTITLAGLAGGTATASLSVTNTTGQQTRIGHRIVDVRRVDGVGPSLVPAIKFVPETLELAPDQEGPLTISLHLDPEKYDTDVIYSGVLYLTGGSDVPHELELRILAKSAASKQSNG